MWPTATATQHKRWSPNHNRADTDDRLDYTVEREAYQRGQKTPPMRLNPTWVEKLMGWPDSWTAVNPISRFKMCFWFMGFCRDEETGREQVLRVLREGNVTQEIWDATGRLFSLPETAVLLSELCEHENRPYEARIFMACAKTFEKEMRGVRIRQKTASASHRPKPNEQCPGEHSNPMQALSRLLAYHGPACWADGRWEDGIPRVTEEKKDRVDRLKALGNGQVPRVVATAWETLR
jgi:hypothetical protein